jgi:hypothetical protein
MAYFAKLNSENIVEQVISINNAVITDANGVEQEQLGVDFINQLYNTNDVWKQTSYNNNIRKNYAGIGYTYDSQRDAFIPPKPYNSWVLNEETCNWDAPIPAPETYINNFKRSDNGLPDPDQYKWNEETLNWTLQTI